MTGGSPRVVALLPSWNAAGFIRGTLDALAAQTYPSFSVFVSDDCSSDNTAAICEDFAKRDGRFRIIRQRERLGWLGNVNTLLSIAEGEYFFFAFHDDLVRPEYVSRLVDALETNPRAVAAFTDVELRRVDGESQTIEYTELEGILDPVERARRVLWLNGHWWVAHRGLFRASAAAQIGGLRPNLAGEFQADWPWQLHMSLLGEVIRVPGVQCCKCLKPGSLAAAWKRTRWTRIAAVLACAREIERSPLQRFDKTRLQLSAASVAKKMLVLRG